MNNLLIVDDEWMITESLSSLEYWAEKRINIVGTASNGQEALEIIEKIPIDIVITDIRMPKMDGLELIKLINTRNLPISIIVISGYEEFTYAYTALKYKVKGYILKPIDVDELMATVDELIKRNPSIPDLLDIQDKSEIPQTYHEAIVSQAQQYALDHLNISLTLIDVAKEIHLNSHYFGQIFKKVTGESFSSYITRIRMERASKLLKQPELKIYTISEMVGYSDSKYFTKLFYKQYGITPKEYRKQLFQR